MVIPIPPYGIKLFCANNASSLCLFLPGLEVVILFYYYKELMECTKLVEEKGGKWMLVEPFANDKLEDNFNPLGRAFYSGSTVACVPASLNDNGPALGAQAGEEKIREIVTSAGFSKFRRATHTPFNLVFEVGP